MSEKEFTKNWFSSVTIEPYLKELKDKDNLRFLEIGTFEGRSACWFLDNFKCSLVTMDPCVPYPIPGHEYINESMYPLLVKNLKPYGSRVDFYRDYSSNVLPKLAPDSFDLIYVDGDHRRDTVAEDTRLSWPLLKRGGFLIFDDYLWGFDPSKRDNPNSPHDAIDAFIAKHLGEIQILARSYYVVLRKN